MDEILTANDYGQQLAKSLVGFTSFRQHLGVFPYTHMSIPAILSGRVYENKSPIDSFMQASLGDNSIISLAKKSGYEVDLAIPRGALTDIYRNVKPDNLYPVDNGAQLMHSEIIGQDATRLFDLALFRAVPHHIKRLIYNNQNWLAQNLSTKSMPKVLQNFVHMAFLHEAAKKISTDREAPVYKLFHLMLSHNPMVTTDDCRPAGAILETNRENVLAQARCGLSQLVVLLDAMKASGIYDNSTIIIMGDHGAWVQPAGIRGIKSDIDGNEQRINPAITALATPFFAVKRPHHTEALKFSDAPSSITDIAKTIAEIQGFENDFDGTSVYDLPVEENRDRRFMFYRYSRSEWTDDYLAPIEEFKVTGSAVDSASWTSLYIYQPNSAVESAGSKSGVWEVISEVDQ